jgi:tetratricopeptide (TPR) repeat protein
MCVDTNCCDTVMVDKRIGSIIAFVLAAMLLSTGCSVGGYASRKPVSPVPSTTANVEKTDLEVSVSPYLMHRLPVASDAMQRFNFSKSAMAQNSWKIAEEGLLTLVEDYPELSGPCLNLALVYIHINENRQAEYWFKQSITRNKNNMLAYNQYAIFLREQGRFDRAEETYLQALSVWEADADTHFNLCILYDLYRGDKKAALQHFNRYQELDNSDDRVVAGWVADLQRQLNSVAVAE